MKIALYHNLTSGGSKRELYEFAKEFHRRGHSLDLYRPTTANESFLPLAPYLNKDRIFACPSTNPIVRRLPGLRKHLDVFGIYHTLSLSKRIAIRIASEINSGCYDFAFIHHDRIVQSPYLGRYLKCPSVYFCAEPMRRFYEPRINRSNNSALSFRFRLAKAWYKWSETLLERKIKRIDYENISYFDYLVTNSFFSNESIYRAYGRRALVIHLGVDILKFAPSPKTPSSQRYILSVGAIAPLKGYDFLIRSVALLPQTKRLPIVVAGNTASKSELEHLRSLADQLKVKIQFKVNVTEEELVELFQNAWIYAYTPVMEPMGLSPLEALACGTPVVGVSEGGLRETLQCQGATILTERLVTDYSAALAVMIHQRETSNDCSLIARQYIEQYWTWPFACQRMIDALTRAGLFPNN